MANRGANRKSHSDPPSQPPPPPWNASRPISELPTHIITDILLRLPDIKSIITCKRVCKTWHDLLLQPYFVKSHLSRGSPSLSLLLHRPSEHPTKPSRFGILELHDPARLRRCNTPVKFTSEIHIQNGKYRNRKRVIGACNGLVCLYSPVDNDIVVWNPILHGRRPFILPKPQPSELKSGVHARVGIGFGYSPLNDEYKVLKAYTKRPWAGEKNTCFEICTLGMDDTWRSIKGPDGQPSPFSTHNNTYVFLNGALHWIGFKSGLWFLCYFDIEKEEFEHFPLPLDIKGVITGLGVVDGNCLYITNYSYQDSINIWVMKDYGDMQSWMLKWVVGKYFRVAPLKTTEDGNVLMIWEDKILLSYDPQTSVIKKIKYHNVRFWKESIAYTPSFVSPLWLL